ncbi:hypothetical protein A3G48_02210 [Candidatus Nomurabacteria bacterium RIFCSPLOWO2_12_FULL_40_42]|uniref:Uncharacterized protein n=1 Tax=Candidatus Nomurabacteria bacterium RIFCSPLOWO2_02_FULL_40_67 TaxID=1801787 RepID=A0A1F6Y7L0_9BACT|nr:MAG: hypothetical protein A2W56_00475 [Candidatus Nomurabacteria bacterium RIFCSPHIGHO2_02_41_18]OGJ02322.1 MAG: hypothetical protein A3I23_02905 [Candidatus Nomurabacteria bacterium RIFCSPLOWO2_02_FULL_40_67]OGJ04089.1 MAG: hypothetical protein A3G48_02210 [Candidatus Nomurabacteria bacterium RIFCSPLOWO2_12_FULL_40_42]
MGIKIATMANISTFKKFDGVSFFLINSENKKNDNRGKNKKSNWLRNHTNVCMLASTAIHKTKLLANKKKKAMVKKSNIVEDFFLSPKRNIIKPKIREIRETGTLE